MHTALLREPYMTVDEYLVTEEAGGVKREYFGGAVYAMSGASEPHNIIALNLYGMLYNRLRGHRCQPFGSDMRLRLQPQPDGHVYFYYPDAMIACDPTDSRGEGWRERPTALFEIISSSTRHVDTREKRLAYLQVGSLQAYVRIEQKRPETIVELRTPGGWKMEQITGLEGSIRLPTLEIELPLAELYERVKFPPAHNRLAS